ARRAINRDRVAGANDDLVRQIEGDIIAGGALAQHDIAVATAEIDSFTRIDFGGTPTFNRQIPTGVGLLLHVVQLAAVNGVRAGVTHIASSHVHDFVAAIVKP